MSFLSNLTNVGTFVGPMLGVLALVGIFYALAKTRKRSISLACMAIGLVFAIVTTKIMVKQPQPDKLEEFNVQLLFMLMNLFFFLMGAAVVSYGLSIITADRELWKTVTDGLLVTLVFFMIIFTGFCSSAIAKALPNEESSGPNAVDRLKLLHQWESRLLIFKAFFVLLGVGVCFVNRYRVFYDANRSKFWLEVLVMGLAGLAAGALQPLFQMNCPNKVASHHVEHILFMIVFSIGLYCVCEFSGVNSLLAIASPVSTAPSSPVPVSMERTLGIEFVLVMLTISMAVLLSVFLVIASNGLGFSTFTSIEACYGGAPPGSTSSAAPTEPAVPKGTLTVGKVKFVLHWFLWALFMNAAYIYVRMNRNPTLGIRSLNGAFWFGEADLQVKFTFFGLLIGIMSVNLNQQSYTQWLTKKTAQPSTTTVAAAAPSSSSVAGSQV
ncbi:hypothetical protein EBZ80_25470 [bacterium]|nr:hypothetical protein [bacterium]